MKYAALKSFLLNQGVECFRLSFEEVAAAAGTGLPASAFKHAAWWANDATAHVQAKAWLEAGYKTAQVDLENQSVEFVRVKTLPPGVCEMAEPFQHNPGSPNKHPLAGALKGTFTITMGSDLTRHTLDVDVLAEWEAGLDRKADMIEEGLRARRP